MISPTASTVIKELSLIEWKVLARLPAINGNTKALGYSGSIAGIHNNHLIITGGTNFPDRMPWDGGMKIFYNDIYVFIKRKGNNDF